MSGIESSRNLKKLPANCSVMHSRGPWLISITGTLLAFSFYLTTIVPLPPIQLLQPSFAEFTEDSLTIEISKSGQVDVLEEVTPRTTVSRINVKAIASNISNILAIDENNALLSASYSPSDGTIRIDTLGSSHVTLTYVADIARKISPETWELSYRSNEMQSTIILPSGSDIIYVNEIPIDINENIITMPSSEETITIRYKIKSLAASNFVASWEGANYLVQVVTISEIYNFSFEQGSKAVILTLDTGQPALVIMPKSLLGGPYSVEASDGSGIDFRQYYQNLTHSWIRIEPSNSEIIRIVGTTVVPEFVLLFALPIAMAVVILFSVLLKQKNSLIF